MWYGQNWRRSAKARVSRRKNPGDNDNRKAAETLEFPALTNIFINSPLRALHHHLRRKNLGGFWLWCKLHDGPISLARNRDSSLFSSCASANSWRRAWAMAFTPRASLGSK